jgi:hypothetical protein
MIDQNTKFHAPFIIGLVILFTLNGCTSVRRELGFEKAPPDEFSVIAKAPLSQPPDYALRPPTPGAPRPQEGTVVDRTREALTGKTSNSTSQLSAGETLILAKTGADRADKNIRGLLSEETRGLVATSPSFVDKILFWRELGPNNYLLDAQSEANRLRENLEKGKSVTEGDSPLISDTTESNWKWIPSLF